MPSRSSHMSVVHNSHSSDIEEDSFHDLDETELRKILSRSRRTCKLLQTENAVLEKVLAQLTDGSAFPVAGQQVPSDLLLGKRARMKKSTAERVSLLSLDNKTEIAKKELEDLKKEKKLFLSRHLKLVEELKARLEESALHRDDTYRLRAEFQRDILQGAVSDRTGKVIAEKLVAYLSKKLKSKESNLGTLRLRILSQKALKKKLKMQLNQKDEIGEALHIVDFDQLRIENKLFMEKVAEKNSEILRLKMVSAGTTKDLNKIRTELQAAEKDSSIMAKFLSEKQQYLDKLKTEAVEVEQSSLVLAQQKEELSAQLDSFVAPSVDDYAMTKTRVQHLRKQLVALERKVSIAEAGLVLKFGHQRRADA